MSNGAVEVGAGVTLSFTRAGSGDPVVLIHGSLTDQTYWDESRQLALLGLEHEVVAYSRRYNHPNQNTAAGDHSPMVEASDLGRLVDALRLGPVHLVGHSYGAYTALVATMHRPEQVRSLTLAEPPIISWLPDIPGGEGIYEGFMTGIWEPLAMAFRDGGVEGGLEFTSRWYFGAAFEDVDPLWQTWFRNNVMEWSELATSTKTFPQLDRARVGSLRVPTLILSGGRNAGGFNDLIDDHLRELIPGAERVIVPDASHEMFLDSPEASALALTGHFARANRTG